MFTTVDDFKANVAGIALTNRFLVDFSSLSRFSKYFPKGEYKYLVRSVDTPEISFNQTAANLWGKPHDIVRSHEYAPFSITFMCDKDMKIRHCFEEWMEDIFDPLTFTANYFDNYISDITITILNGKLQPVRTYTFLDAYPKDLSKISLSHDNDANVMTFSATFVHKGWKSEAVSF